MQQAINMGVNMMDTMMLGNLGETALSASSLANQYYMFFTIFCLGIIGGCSVLTAQYWGAGDKKRVRETFNMALWISFALCLLFMVVTMLFPEQIMTIYTSEADVIREGARYLEITAFIFILHGTSLVGSSLMRTVGKPRLGLVVSIVSFFVNVFFNYVFIFGKFGAPRMEIAGAALGTLIARATEFLITFIYIFVIDKALELKPKHLKRPPSVAMIREYFRIGAPVLISDALLGLGGNIVSVVMGHMGTAVVAANAICMVVDRLCIVVIQGIANAAGIIVGNTIGSGEKEKVQEQGQTFYLMSLIIGVISAVLVLIIGPMTIGLYTVTEETSLLTKEMMYAYTVIVFFQCIQSVMTKGVLRGGGDTRFLMVADILFMWLVSVPLGAVGGLVLHWPAWLVMICLRIDYMIKSIWCISRLLSGKWIHEADGIRHRIKKAA
ncbi:MAG: MATE family efflux transporter [Lachnospiraceae bacterium]|nr:MATE family efflux transporter [Lachnospiraceae bacterium]